MIDLNNVLARAIELAKQSPQAVYLKLSSSSGREYPCYYTMGEAAGRKGCLIGQALVDCGIPASVLEWYDSQKPLPIHILVRNLVESEHIAPEVPVKLIYMLNAIQANQDEGISWGRSNQGESVITSVDVLVSIIVVRCPDEVA